MQHLTYREALEHARGISVIEAEERAKQMMPHYLFVEGNEKHREGFCSACERWVDCGKEAMQQVPKWVRDDPYLDDGDGEYPFIPFQNMHEHDFERRNSGRTLHNDTGYCPECGARVTFKNIGRGYRSLYDRRFFFRWHKSCISPRDTLVGVGYDVLISWRDFDPCNPEVPITLDERELVVIRYGQGGDRFIHELKWCGVGGWDMRWARRSECKSGWAPGAYMFNSGIQTILDAESFNEAISGTPFASVIRDTNAVGYSSAGSYYDRIAMLERIARYPCIEYMAKLGYHDLALAVIDRNTDGLINLRGKTARSVLRLTKDEWGEVKGKKLTVTIGMLGANRFCKKHKIRLNMELCGKLARGSWERTLKDIIAEDPGADLAKAIKYCIRKDVFLYEWLDQLRLMRHLQMNIHDKEWRYPKDFRQAHNTLIARWNAILAERKAREKSEKESEQNAKIAARLQSGELDEYFFSANGLVLKPMTSAGEIILEGSRQGHCVAGYVNTYANGNDVLCTLRLETHMAEPLYTVEFGSDGKLIQCRARKNGEGPISAHQREVFWRLHRLMRADLKAQKAKEENEKKRKGNAA